MTASIVFYSLMNRQKYTIRSNERLTQGNGFTPDLSVWKMVLCGDTSAITAPGQFVNIALPGRYLRRPISICDWDATTITIVYREVGVGTLDMTRLGEGTEVEMLTGLGNGFATEGCGTPLLVGGGVGLPPMLGLAKAYLAKGIKPIVVAGFNSSSDVILKDEFAKAGLELLISTMDGSAGVKGTVMEIIKDLEFDYFQACGPKPMLKALADMPKPGQVSVEERMGCGFGVCMGCSCKTTEGVKRVCKDGPVFEKEMMIW